MHIVARCRWIVQTGVLGGVRLALLNPTAGVGSGGLCRIEKGAENGPAGGAVGAKKIRATCADLTSNLPRSAGISLATAARNPKPDRHLRRRRTSRSASSDTGGRADRPCSGGFR